MTDFQEQLASRVQENGWWITQQTTQSFAEEQFVSGWLMESTMPPVGLLVEVRFRVTDFRIWRYWRTHSRSFTFDVRVRLAEQVDSPEVTLSQRHAEADNFRQILRVLQWFRNPDTPVLWQDLREGDWLPPAADVHPLRGESGLEVRWSTESCTPEEMLGYLRVRLSERRLRLLAVNLCRQLPLSMLHEKNQLVVSAAEQYAEGQISRRELKKTAKFSRLDWLVRMEPAAASAEAVRQLRREDPARATGLGAEAIREVAGDPFNMPAINRLWLKGNGGEVERLVQSIATTGDFAAMPILADALEDIGCSSAVLLTHCRQATQHAAGCWALDLLRGLTASDTLRRSC